MQCYMQYVKGLAISQHSKAVTRGVHESMHVSMSPDEASVAFSNGLISLTGFQVMPELAAA